MTTGSWRTVLTIAGSDGSGGAGIQADLKTFAALGCYGLSVITSVTAQNTLGVSGAYDIPESFVAEQFRTIERDIPINAVKIGMLAGMDVIRTVAELLRPLHDTPVVLDTVLRSSSGRVLLESGAVPVLMEELFPLATLITPNLPETALLKGSGSVIPETPEEIEHAAMLLCKKGARSVLIKGGHMKGTACSDLLLHEGRYYWFTGEKIESENTHGTGCTLSSAIAACLAKGEALPVAVDKAILYTRRALQAGSRLTLGHGNGPLQHFPDLYRTPLGNRPME
jgi:hydroxymethylpyrimidine/phosphomethylpyrimidine kinase